MKFALALLASVISATESVLNDDLAASSDEYYNILTMDGGGIKGLIICMVLEQMEMYAWTYATEQKYEFPKYGVETEGHFALKDIFDMTAGTSIGSILAAGLASPDLSNTAQTNQNLNKKLDGTFIKPENFAKDLIKICSKDAQLLFAWRQLGWVLPVSIIVCLILFGLGGYKLGVHLYDNPRTIASFRDLRKVISNAKRENKNLKSKFSPEQFEEVTMDKEEQKDEYFRRVGDTKKETFRSKDTLLALSKKNRQQDILSAEALKNLQKQPKLKEIEVILQYGIKNNIPEASASLLSAERDYNQGKPKKWIVFLIFFIIGGSLGFGIPKLSLMLAKSQFSRMSFDNYIQKTFGPTKFDAVTTNELLVVSYAYNSQQPRFFSKYMTAQDPLIYDTKIGNATASSSSCPGIFNPHEIINGYNLTEFQIDGAPVSNNPTLYALEMSRQLYGHQKTRIISLGTGYTPFTPVVAKDFSTATRFKMTEDFLYKFDASTADYWTRYTIGDQENNYIRAQIISSIDPFEDSPAAIKDLKDAGAHMWNEFEKPIKNILRQIIDQKYGPKSAPQK